MQWTSPAPAPQPEARKTADADKRLKLLLDRATGIHALAPDPPALLASGPGGETWTLQAREGAAAYAVGARRRGDDWQPIFFCATGLPPRPGATFDEALGLVRSLVLRDTSADVEVSASRVRVNAARTTLETWGNRTVAAPWPDGWVFLIDDAPLANWAHPCRHVFLAPDLSALAVRDAFTPLTLRDVSAKTPCGARALETVLPFDRSRTAASATPPPVPRSIPPRTDGDASRCYAVILSGGLDSFNNHVRYWGDASFIYSTLSLQYGYPKDHLFALISDGLDPSADQSDATDSPADLDGDGLPDTYGAATFANVSNLFVELQGRLRPDDQLFVFTTDHGGPADGGGPGDVLLYLWGGDVLRDFELRALTEPIACPLFFAMEQCYSGGFVDDLAQPNRFIATAARHDEPSYAGNTFPEFDQWAYHFTAALRGFQPQPSAPWVDAGTAHGDLNSDAYVSFDEAARYAAIHKFPDDHPTCGENPPGLGARGFATLPRREDLGMGGFVIAPIHSPQTASGFPVRISAQNVFGDPIPAYVGPLNLSVEAAPIDPGTYVGAGDLSWDYPAQSYYMDARTQVIYPATLLGPARTLDHLALHVDQPPTCPLSRWTIRLRHTPLTAYPEEPVWEPNGWTVVFQSNLVHAATGWVVFAFSQPFAYDGVNSLMVDFSFDNSSYGPGNGHCRASESAGPASITWASDDADGDPLLWSGNLPPPQPSPRYPNLRFGPPPIPVEVPIAPTSMVRFADGAWSGSVSALNTHFAVRLHAADRARPQWRGQSDWFAILDYPFELVAAAIDPLAGSLRLQWNSGAGRTYRVMASTNLSDGFFPLATHLPADPPVFDAPLGDEGKRFFRVEEE